MVIYTEAGNIAFKPSKPIWKIWTYKIYAYVQWISNKKYSC